MGSLRLTSSNRYTPQYENVFRDYALKLLLYTRMREKERDGAYLWAKAKVVINMAIMVLYGLILR